MHHIFTTAQSQLSHWCQLVGGIPTPLKNLTSSVGIIIPNIWTVMIHSCSKPPTSIHIYIYISHYCWIYPIISPSNPIDLPSTTFSCSKPPTSSHWCQPSRLLPSVSRRNVLGDALHVVFRGSPGGVPGAGVFHDVNIWGATDHMGSPCKAHARTYYV